MKRSRFGVTSKLFLAILATCIVVTIAMGMAVRFSFERGFERYMAQREARQIEAITAILADYHREAGNWDELRGQPRRWWRLLRSIPHAGERQREQSPMSFIPPSYALLDEHGAIIAGGAPSSVRDATRGTTPEGLPDARYARLPQARQSITHDLPSDSRRHPIDVDGRIVGWLAVPSRASAATVVDRRFAAQQTQATWLISALSVLLAALVSVLLARSLIAPLRRLGLATHRLASGDYTARVHVSSQDELGQLARDFNHLALTLERNERMRRDMVADISHDLRTPLAILQGELEALQDGVRALTPESLSSLQAEVATLKKLIDDLYELSLADVGAMHYRMTRVDVGALLTAVCASFRERFTGRGLSLQVQTDPLAPPMHGDPQRLTQLFNNLLENSLRYTDPDGLARVSLRVDSEDLLITIEDSPPGVPAELLPRLFERMFRADPSRSRESGGSGLGLALAARIVEAHGGQITAAPASLGGIAIVMRLPHLGSA